MPRIKEEVKERRKERIWMLIRQHNGISQKELSKLSSIENRTVYNYLDELEYEGKVYKEGVLWFEQAFQETKLRQFEMSPEETYTLYLAARLFVKQLDKRNEYAETALYRLAEVLKSDVPVSPDIQKAAQQLARREDQPGYQDSFQKLIQAYLRRNRVKLTYKPLWGQSFETTFAIYLIEPSAIGFSTYLIGHSALVDDLRVYKLDRVESVAVLRDEQPYSIPSDFPGLAIFDKAWSIITGEETTRVVLRFSDKVAQRVLETNWHPSQGYDWDKEKEGYLRWWVDIADTTDIFPWIRGWGQDVEVLAPDTLRESLKIQVKHLAQTYNLNTQTPDLDSRLLQLWGKTTKKNPDLFHPALYHLFDVAHVAQQLLSTRASSRWRQILATGLNADGDTLVEWLPYLVALHDIGKISVPFQILNEKQRTRLQGEGFVFGRATKREGQKLHHSLVGRMVLQNIMHDWPQNLKVAFEEMVSGHHGLFQMDTREQQRDFRWLKEAEEWSHLRQRAIDILESYLRQHWPDPLPNPANQSAAMMALTGFCILCDWLGSDKKYFTPAPLVSLTDYIRLSRQQAYKRVQEAGFFAKAETTAPTQFTQLFDDLDGPPRPVQAAIEAIPDGLLEQPTLTIIESPTGEGKTEAAKLLARRIGAKRGYDEIYFALPTTATSNAMFERVKDHVEKRLGLSKNLVRLIHGQDFLDDEDDSIQPMESVEPGQDSPSESPALTWFEPKKKALLAPIGVGTIDQAELAALNVRHNALRMLGLAGKTIILDEVHAYDTYMTTIIKRMLTWLGTLGSSVILLSATLPTARRKELAQAFAGDSAKSIENLADYPSLLTISASGCHTDTPDPVQPDKSITLHLKDFVDDAAQQKAAWLVEQVAQGGCVCWMTNTVKRAQQIYQHLLEMSRSDVTCDLLHARFPLAERKKREMAIMARYGKTGQRPEKGIVVGTQVLEQSLDLDFDVMITDLAPIDLVLQRAGRLHRHEREAATRYRHQTPYLYVNTTLAEADKTVYDDYILQKTLQVLNDIAATRQTLTLPADYRTLIEEVYDETEPETDDELYEAWMTLKQKRDYLKIEARQRLVNSPQRYDSFHQTGKFNGFEDDEAGSGWLNMKTRWGQDSVTVIPLLREGDLAQTLAGDTSVSTRQKADRDTQLRLLRQSLRISHPGLVKHFRNEQEPCVLFTDSALLKNVFPLWLVPDEANFVGQATLPVEVHLCPDLGLVIGTLT